MYLFNIWFIYIVFILINNWESFIFIIIFIFVLFCLFVFVFIMLIIDFKDFFFFEKNLKFVFFFMVIIE